MAAEQRLIAACLRTAPSPPAQWMRPWWRFTDPGEQGASLALREGDPAAVAYYADHNRLHVGTLGDAVTSAWRGRRADTAAGHDSILLAPTRDLVGQLNALARTERLTRSGAATGPEVRLGDGLAASAGDIVTTRRNTVCRSQPELLCAATARPGGEVC